MQANDPVHLRGQPFIMRCDERGAAFAPHEPQELIEHLVGRGFIEIARRLVGNDNLGMGYDGTCDADPLLLTARQLARHAVGKFIQTHAQYVQNPDV